jgi:hypothetical protein
VKILLGDFNAKVRREDIFKPTIGNENLHEISNDNVVIVVNFTTSKNLIVKNTLFPHCNIHKFTWTSPDWKNHNKMTVFRYIGDGIQVQFMSDRSGQQIVTLTTTW